MPRELLQNARLPAPVGYARAVRASGTTTICTSMTAPIAEDGSVVGAGDAHLQTLRVLSNIRDILEDHGASLDDVTHLTAFVVDRDDFADVAAGINETFGSSPPAISMAAVIALPNPSFAVEIAAIAVLAG